MIQHIQERHTYLQQMFLQHIPVKKSVHGIEKGNLSVT